MRAGICLLAFFAAVPVLDVMPATPVYDIQFIDVPRGLTVALPAAGQDNVWNIDRNADETVITHTGFAAAGIRHILLLNIKPRTFIDNIVTAAQRSSGLMILKSGESLTVGGVAATSATFRDDTTGTFERFIVYPAGTGTGALVFYCHQSEAEELKPIFGQVLQAMKIEPAREGAIGVRWKSARREVWAPNSAWEFQLGKTSIRLNRVSDGRQIARAYVHPVGHNKTNLETAYAEHKQEILKSMSGDQIIADHQPVTLSGKVPGFSITHKDATRGILKREIVFLHNLQCNELGFSVNDADFETLKTDLSWIVQSLVLH
jgi:hypothetical protein